jgi:xanthine dehydrogenase accessory factor
LRELRDILASLASADGDEPCVLVTVVHAAGSTYRRPGARMLILPNDEMIGLISGGCLEGDLLEHARAVRCDRTARLVHYDASAKEDIIWGLGLGCAGVVDVLLEPISTADRGVLGWLREWREARSVGVVATALADERLGQRWALHPDGRIEATGGDASAFEDERIAVLLREAQASGRSRRVASDLGEVAIEIVHPPVRLIVFGAGPDVAPVQRLAQELGWDVEICDARPAYARADRFPGAKVLCVAAEEAVAAVGVDEGSYCVVMTHHYLHDRALLVDLLPSSTPYVGLLGPKQRAEDLLAELADQGVMPSDEQRARLYAPAGLDLGGEGPEAIAFSLVGEILALSEDRSGSWLRDRKGPIHDACPA